LRRFAQDMGWRIAASNALAGTLDGLTLPGRRADTARGDAAVELLPLVGGL
jgi:hypothetical protein